MRNVALLSALTLALAACSEAPGPTEPQSRAEHLQPLFNTTTSTAGYTAIDLGAGDGSRALAVNELGQVVGYFYPTGTPSPRNLFVWDPADGLHDLGIPYPGSYVFINDAGQVAGGTYGAVCPNGAFLWDPQEGIECLPTFGGPWTSIRDLNNAGRVVGVSVTGEGNEHPFFWDGTMHDLGTLGREGYPTRANAINELDQVVGESVIPSGPTRAFIWESGDAIRDIGTLGGWQSHALDINDLGQVVGMSHTVWGDRLYNAFIWEEGVGIQGLGFVDGSSAMAINSRGQILGSHKGTGFLWDGVAVPLPFPVDAGSDLNNAGQVLEGNVVWSDGTTYPLPSLAGDARSWTEDINDGGHVVGYSSATTSFFPQHATLWRILTPVEQLGSCAALAGELEAQGVLNSGQAHSLVNKINLATAALNDGKSTPAINKLEAFQNEASGYVNGGNLTPEQGDGLISCVQSVIDSL